jgi:hypothetical protein
MNGFSVYETFESDDKDMNHGYRRGNGDEILVRERRTVSGQDAVTSSLL